MPVEIDTTFLPGFGTTIAPRKKPEQRNLFKAGLSAGVDELQGLLGSALQGAGKLTGLPTIEGVGRDIAARNALESQANGRPDLEIAPWKEGGASVLPWLSYQAAKQVPLIGTYMAGGMGYKKLGGAVPEAVEAFATAVPRALGGGGVLPGASWGARRAAIQGGSREAGRDLGRDLIGGTIAGIPIGFGAMVQEADSKPGGVTVADVRNAALLSPVYSALDALQPAGLKGMLKRGSTGTILRRMATAGVVGAAAEVPQEGMQTALEVSFRPDMSIRDKMTAVVDAAITGGAVGGVFGTAGGVRRLKSMDPATVTDDDLISTIDEVLGLPSPQSLAGSVPGPGTVVSAGPAGAEVSGVNDSYLANEPATAPRPYENTTTEELSVGLGAAKKAIEAGKASDEVKRFVEAAHAELTLRNPLETSPVVPGETVEAVQPELGRQEGAAEQLNAPASAIAPDWVTTRDSTLLKGISTRKWYAEAESEEDVKIILNARLSEGVEKKGDLELARRLGIDPAAPGEPIVLPAEIAPTPVPVAAAEPTSDFAARWKTDVQKLGQKDHGARAIKPKDEDDAKRQIYRALGAKREIGDGLERLAQRYGVLDENKQLTPEAIEIARTDSIPYPTAAKAAKTQGFTGDATPMFVKGVKSYLGGPIETQFDGTQAVEAYAAGATWAEEHNSVPKVASNYWTEGVLRTDKRSVAAELIDKDRMTPPPAQLRQKELNTTVDTLVSRGEINADQAAPIKRLIAQGVTDVDEAVRYVKSGRGSLLTDNPPSRPFRGSIAERGGFAEKLLAESRTRAMQHQIESERQLVAGKQADEAADAIARHRAREAIKQRLFELEAEVDAELAAEAGNPSELNVDERGVLRDPYFMINGKASISARDELQAAQVISAVLDQPNNPRAAMEAIVELGGELGKMAKRYMKYVPADLKVIVAQRDEMIEIGKDSGWSYEPLGLYDHQSNTIVFSVRQMHPSIILHEFVHAIVGAHIYRKSPIGRQIESIFDRFKEHGPKDDYAFTNANEFIAEFISREQVRDYVREFSSRPGSKTGNIFQRVWSAIRKALGMPSVDYVEKLLKLAEAAGEQRLGPHKALLSPMLMNERAMDTVSAITRSIPIESKKTATRKMVFGWNSIGHLVSHYAKQFPQLALYAKAHLERRATQARWAQLFETPYQVYETLERENPKAADNIRWLMSMTEFEIDPAKAWDQHIHLHGAANEDMLKARVEKANRTYNALRGKGNVKVYNDFKDINEATHFSMMAVSLHNLVASDPVLRQGMEGFDVDPTDAFRERPALHESPANARRYWSDTLDNQVKRADEFIVALRGEVVGSTREENIQKMRLEPIEMRLKSIRQSLEAMRNAPYFHLGRHGEHFVSFQLRRGEDKNVDPAAIEAAGKAIEDAGFKHIQISRDSTKPKVYIRVDTQEARDQLEQVALQLQRSGWIPPDSEIKAAPRTDAGDVGTADAAPVWLERFIELLQASPMFEPTDNMSDQEKGILAGKKAQMVSHARELWLDMLPDTAIAKVMVHRNSIPGFDKDMIRNFAFRFQVGVNALSNLSASAKLNNAFTEMRTAVNDAQVVDAAQHSDVDLLQSLLSEVLIREAQRPLRSGTNWVDTWRALNHAFFLGMSPSYVLVNMTQIGVLLWPELSKKHGFAKAAGAIGGVTGTAVKIMTATMRHGVNVGWKRAADAVITEKVLKDAGIDESTAEFLMKIIADGVIDIGGSARELGRVADASVSSKLDTGLRYAAAAGLYSETFTRLVAALASRKLNGDDLPYAHNVIDQSMLNYADWNTARQMGKMGFAGQMTKVMTAFLQYSAQVTEKLYREMHTAFMARAASPKEKAEARKFLAGHLVAVTTLAGTLGMPFATVGAFAIEKLVDLLGDDEEPFDATAAWRNFLSSVMGDQMGEVVSRGIPRAAGFDLSQRAGEQHLMPFSQLLTDKRKWREAAAEMALRMSGAPVSMGLSILEGGEKIGNGDLLGGMAAAMPVAIKGPTQAYRMYEDGYIDTKGNKLPMTPRQHEILWQLLGFTPAQKAEYSEARGDQAGRKSVLMAQAKTLRTKILKELEPDGDPQRLNGLIDEALRFDAANEGFAVLTDVEASLKRRAKAQILSEATSTPIGVSIKDPGGQDLTGYANIEFRAQ